MAYGSYNISSWSITDGKFGPEAISPETFPLPSDLRDRLRKISYDCYRGRGFGVVRDLYSEALTEEEKVLVFAGVACHVAPQRGFQDSSREVVTCIASLPFILARREFSN